MKNQNICKVISYVLHGMNMSKNVKHIQKCHEYKHMRKDVFGKEYFYKATQFWPTDVIFKSLDIFVLEFNIGRSMTKMRRNPNEPSHQLFLLVLARCKNLPWRPFWFSPRLPPPFLFLFCLFFCFCFFFFEVPFRAFT